MLRRRFARPVVFGLPERLSVRGRLPAGGVAIVGSREPPVAMAEYAYQLAFTLGEPIVAGLAPGIDVAAHRGALAAGVPTVAFVPYGFGCTDPPEHAELEDAIVRAGGAVATLLPPGTPASPESRIARDRLQAEHARAVVLVCSEIQGGALYTMRFARELGRARYAVMPPSDACGVWAGNEACIEAGATPLPLDVNEACARIRQVH
jgi:DNA processing protein